MFEPQKTTPAPILPPRAAPAVAAPVAPAPSVKDESLLKGEDFVMDYGRLFGLVLGGIILLSVIILLLGYYFFVFSFNNKIAKLETAAVAKQEAVNKLESWKQNVVLLEAEKDKFEQMVPAEKDLSGVLIQLETLAKKYNLVFNSITNKTDSFAAVSTEEKNFKKQSYEVVLSGGDYFTLKKFLAEIESSLRIVAPQSLAYSPDVNMFMLTFDIYHR